MKLGIIADSHDRLPALEAAVTTLRQRGAEAMLHAGDFVAPFAAKRLTPEAVGGLPVYVCFGNNDGEREGLKTVLPQLQDGPVRVELGGRTIVMHHFIDWLNADDIADADVVVTGHTHEVVEQRDGSQLRLNPGECCGWVHGRPTAALLETDDLSVDIIDLAF